MRSLAIALKDMTVWLRDVAAMGVLLGMPIVLIFILGSALGGSGTDTRTKVIVVNLDAGKTGPVPGAPPTSSQGVTTNLGDELVQTLKDSTRLNKAFAIAYAERDSDAVRRRVANGDAAALLVVPADFTARVREGEPAQLEVVSDPGSELSAGIWQGVVESFAAKYSAASVSVQTMLRSAERYAPAPLDPKAYGQLQAAAIQASTHQAEQAVVIKESQTKNLKGLNSLDYYAVSMTAMFLMFGAMFGAFSTIKERREQTLSRLQSTPTSGTAVVGGKMLGIFGLGMLQFTVLYLSTRFIFGVDWGTSIGAVFLIAAAEMLAVTGLAVLIGSIAKTERGAGGLAPLIIQIQALLGGAFFTITILPLWLQPVRYASVVGWALEGWQTVQLRGGGVPDVIGPVGALLGFALALFAVSAVLAGVRR